LPVLGPMPTVLFRIRSLRNAFEKKHEGKLDVSVSICNATSLLIVIGTVTIEIWVILEEGATGDGIPIFVGLRNSSSLLEGEY